MLRMKCAQKRKMGITQPLINPVWKVTIKENGKTKYTSTIN